MDVHAAQGENIQHGTGFDIHAYSFKRVYLFERRETEEEEGETEKEAFHLLFHSPDGQHRSRATRGQEFFTNLPHGWQQVRSLDHILLSFPGTLIGS